MADNPRAPQADGARGRGGRGGGGRRGAAGGGHTPGDVPPLHGPSAARGRGWASSRELATSESKAKYVHGFLSKGGFCFLLKIVRP